MKSKDHDSYYLVEQLQGLNELIFKQSLEHSEHSVNVSLLLLF